jgi:hypothetical protein
MGRTGRPLALALVVALAPACATKRYDVTAIAAVPKAAGRVDGRGATLRISGLEVRLEATDAVPAPQAVRGQPSAGKARPLALRLCFRASELGYSLDPTRVVLRRGDQVWSARADALAPGASRVWIASGRSCLDLGFDTPVDPGPSQQVVLDGLARGRTPLAPVVLPVARRAVQERHLTPAGVEALTLPLKILLAPLAMYGGI